MIEIVHSAALVAGGLLLIAFGLLAAAGAIAFSGALLFEACKYFIKAGIIETYNVVSVRYYMAVMVKHGRTGLLKHVEDARTEQQGRSQDNIG